MSKTQHNAKSLSDLMNIDVDTLTTSEVTELWLMLSLIEKLIEGRKKELHPRLMGEAEAKGVKNEAGSYTLALPGGSQVLRERREGKQLDIDKVVALLASKEIAIEEGCDEQVSWVVNLSKIQHLTHNGKLTQAEVEEIRNVTWALKVSGSKDMKNLLEEVKDALTKVKK